MIKPGEKYGMLTVMKEAGRTNSGRLRFECQCDCGNVSIAESSNIERGHTNSCGCIKERLRYKHDMVDTSEYHSWCALRSRCYNENAEKYPGYGGRGITVCDEWLESFSNFLKDMGLKPGPDYSIERIDNDGNYEPGNCKWATDMEQASNKRSNHNLTYKGETHPIAEWERTLGFKAGTVKRRIYAGWPTEKALETPTIQTGRW